MVHVCSQAIILLGLASLALSVPVEPKADQMEASPDSYNPRCNQFYKIQHGDTCWDIVSENENTFTMDQLLCWNPDINPWCSNLIPGRNVCVGVTNPGQLC
ncbi:hypothetical protein N7466_004368 [Penicillium verhagenii]|uniref:uncharacterized protein n=1 Tax=Penicillium verhagenii TaxID=1562060 RepID=UPI002545419A|nr:uncharacterized protein N7466_004368 [Penicillium verhagenii]KAJ5934821.1 hypothetical protein N7466_004368 [Penicillium verhagenii]